MKFFTDIDIQDIRGCVVIIDVDGTITIDNSSLLDEKTLSKIYSIAKHNIVVYFLSNKKNKNRNLKITQKTKIPFIDSKFKKPSKKIFEVLNLESGQKIIVIGDKFLTDGLLARNIGAGFVKVRHLQSPNDGLIVNFFYYLDNIFFQVSLYKTNSYIIRFYNFLRLLIFPINWFSNLMNNLNGQALSLGCGYGILEVILAHNHKNLYFTASDFSKRRIASAINSAKNITNIHFILQDATQFKEDKKYNNVILIDLLHHLPDGEQLRLLDKIWNVTIPNGIIIIKDVDVQPKWKYLWNYLHDYLLAGPPLTYYNSDFYVKYFLSKNAIVNFHKPVKFYSPYNHYAIEVIKKL